MKRTTFFFFLTTTFLLAALFLSLLPHASFLQRTITGYATSSTTSLNITVGNTAPSITFVSPLAAADPTENGVKIIHLNFTATDTDGSSNINDTSARVYLQRAGQTTRSNVTCAPLGSAFGNSKNFTCAVGIQYFDGAGSWTLNTTIFDVNAATAENSTSSFTYNQLTSMVMSPASLSWASIGVTTTDALSNNDPLLLNNTGNSNLTNVTVRGIDLSGEVLSTKFIYASNFTVNIADACSSGSAMVNASYVRIGQAGVNATINPGNHSTNDGSTGQEQLYFCLEAVNSDLTAQAYSTAGTSTWTVQVATV